MAMTINTNVASLNAQRNLSGSKMKLDTAIERLSSGLRINSAKDDAAGLAISTRFTTQINGLNRAVKNANDGISLAQTTESALDEVTNNLQRIRELAVQAANGSNSSSDRASLNAEVQQRLSEINRIATQTDFNGRKVLDGSAGAMKFQVGANVGQTIDVNLAQSVKTDSIGQYNKTSATASGALTLVAGKLSLTADQTITVGSKTATITKGDYTADTLQAAMNSAFSKAGISTAVATVTQQSATAGTLKIDTRLGADDAAGDADIGANTAFGITAATASVTTGAAIDTADVSTVAGANDTMDSVDAALQSISDIRSDLGAIQNRFESTIANLQTISQNLDSSRSSIQDADFAQETANMSSAQILQQAGVSVLAQANQSQQNVLKLLQ
jgi:flagellin